MKITDVEPTVLRVSEMLIEAARASIRPDRDLMIGSAEVASR